jgi:hypothetical protein
MLNDYLTYDLLREEMIDRDYILKTVDKDDGWIGGPLIVPFQGASASSLQFGGLTPSNDVGQSKYVRGKITNQPEVWGTLKFYQRDLMEHNQISEKNFLKLLPDEIDRFLDYMKMAVSLQLLNGPWIATATGNGDASGNITVDRPDRFTLNQKVEVADNDTGTVVGFVNQTNGINMATGNLNLVTTLYGSTPVDLTAYTTAQKARIYHPGALSAPFSSLKSMLLSLANGGTAALYGQTKLAYPYLQAFQYSGSSITNTLTAGNTNLMTNIFRSYTENRRVGKGRPSNILMSFRNFGLCLQIIEASKGAFNVVPGSRSTSQYGWDEVKVGSVTGELLTLIAINEMDDDYICQMDWRAVKFFSNGFFRKNKSPDGNEYYVERATDGYQYLVDVCLFGDLVLSRPSYCGIIYGLAINYTA